MARPTDIKYLGYGLYTNRAGTIKPKPHLKSIQKFMRKLKQITKRSWSITLKERITRLNQVIRWWINYFKIGDMKAHMINIGAHIRRRIRCLVWKQWKVASKRITMLRKLGTNEGEARRLAYTRKKYWNTSLYLNNYITNEILNKLGLVFPLDHYSKVHIVIN